MFSQGADSSCFKDYTHLSLKILLGQVYLFFKHQFNLFNFIFLHCLILTSVSNVAEINGQTFEDITPEESTENEEEEEEDEEGEYDEEDEYEEEESNGVGFGLPYIEVQGTPQPFYKTIAGIQSSCVLSKH